MAGVSRNQFTEAMKQDLYNWYWESYDDVAPVWGQLFDVVQSNAAYEKFNSAIGLGELMEKPEGEDLQADAPMESYTIVCKNRSFGRLVRFTYETVKDAQKGGNLLQSAVQSWSRMVPITKDKFYAKFWINGAKTAGNDVFNNSITGVVDDPTGNVAYDGKPWFSTTHASRTGATYANYTETRSLTSDNLQTTWLTFHSTNNRDERDELISLRADTLLLPTALKFTAAVILESTLIPGSMDNDTNVMRAILNPMEWGQLTDADGWFMISRGKGLMATEREDVGLDFWQDETSKDYFASIFCRFGGAVTNWRYAYACNITST